MTRALVVDANCAEREWLQLILARAGYTVTGMGSGQAALDVARDHRYDLVILELVLPDIDGITVCRALRSAGANCESPLLMLSARGSEADRILGLESGADDYIVKPVTGRELTARMGAVIRRCAAGLPKLDGRTVGNREVLVDLDSRMVDVRGASVVLTPPQFDLLALLASRSGIVFTRRAIIASLWRGESAVTERTVDALVSHVRRKIERDPRNPRLLLTRWGVGYHFSSLDDSPQGQPGISARERREQAARHFS